jgi:hypothetical protein
MRERTDLPPPRGAAPFPAMSEIGAADAKFAFRQRLVDAGKKREEEVKKQAKSAAQRYLDEREKTAPTSVSTVWGAARFGAKGIVVPPASDPTGRARVPRYVRSAFDAFDANNSGYLDYRELRHALNYMGYDVQSDRAAQAVLSAYDDHPDGKLGSRPEIELGT